MPKPFRNLESESQELLLKEYELLEQIISRHDRLCFWIKGWAVTLWTGFTAYIIKEDLEPFLHLLVAFAIVFGFLSLDALYSVVRSKAIERVGEIEKYYRDDHLRGFTRDFRFPDIDSLSISGWFNNLCGFVNALRKSRVLLPHIALVIISFILFCTKYNCFSLLD